MAEDKYAPNATDSVKEVHNKHLQLIADQKAANKKAREASHQPKPVPAKPETHQAAQANPGQPPAVETPQNPSAPQHTEHTK